MSLCINPNCSQPDHPENVRSDVCQSCHSELLLQGRYRAVRLLSDNTGFGTVYEADDRGTAKILKVLKINASKAIELFQQESQVLSQLHHPGIPKIDRYFTLLPKNSKKLLHCLVMEKIQGQNLQTWMHENPPLNIATAIDWLKQSLDILSCVHQKNFFHRDIKPANIMLRPNGQLALIDFGTAREITQTYLAKMGGRSGITSIASAGYTPLEQNNGKAVPQSDFYALGRTFVYLLTGKHPTEFDEDPGTGNLIWQPEVKEVFPPLLELLDEMMAPFPAQRPKDTQEILNRLTEIEKTYNLYRAHPSSLDRYKDAQHQTVDASVRSPDFAQRASSADRSRRPRSSEVAAASVAAPNNEGARGKKRFKAWLWLAGGGAAVLVAAASSAQLWQMRSRPTVDVPVAPLTVALPQWSDLPLPDAPPSLLMESPPTPTAELTLASLQLEDEDKQVMLKVLSMRQKRNSMLLEISLQNKSALPVKFFSNFIELIDDREQELSAIPEGLPEELPPNGKVISGNLAIPQGLLVGSQFITLKLADPEDGVALEIPQIPIAEFDTAKLPEKPADAGVLTAPSPSSSPSLSPSPSPLSSPSPSPSN